MFRYQIFRYKAVTKSETCEVIYHFTARFELSSQIDCNNLVGPIGLQVIFLTPGVKFGTKNCFAVLSTFSCTSTWWLDFFKHVICNKQIITC